MKKMTITEESLEMSPMTLGDILNLLYSTIDSVQEEATRQNINIDVLDLLFEMRQMQTLQSAGYSEEEAVRIIHGEDA